MIYVPTWAHGETDHEECKVGMLIDPKKDATCCQVQYAGYCWSTNYNDLVFANAVPDVYSTAGRDVEEYRGELLASAEDAMVVASSILGTERVRLGALLFDAESYLYMQLIKTAQDVLDRRVRCMMCPECGVPMQNVVAVMCLNGDCPHEEVVDMSGKEPFRKTTVNAGDAAKDPS